LFRAQNIILRGEKIPPGKADRIFEVIFGRGGSAGKLDAIPLFKGFLYSGTGPQDLKGFGNVFSELGAAENVLCLGLEGIVREGNVPVDAGSEEDLHGV